MLNPVRRSASPIADADLADFEATLGTPLPPAYREFLLAHNGGVPRRGAFQYAMRDDKRRKAFVTAFLPLTPEGWAEAGCLPLPDQWAADGGELIDGTLAVGIAETDVNEGTIRLGVAGKAAGRVFFRPNDTARGRAYPVAESWTAFLAGMKHRDKPDPWDEPIEDGNADLLRQWLTQYRRKWDHGGDRITIERKAIQENQAGILQMLIAEFGFEPPSIVEEALDAQRLDLALRFVPAAAESPEAMRDVLARPGPFFWHVPLLVESLIEAGADVTHERDDGQTPLHYAAAAGAAEAVRLLLARGADPTLPNDEGLTPRDLAERAELPEVAAILREAEASHAPADGDETRPFDLHGVAFARTGKPITLAEIREVEAKLKLDFPPEYRWLLLQANGAVLRPNLLPEHVLPELYARDAEDEDDEQDDPDAEGEGPEIRVDLYPLREADCVHDRSADGEVTRLGFAAEDAQGWYHDGSEMPRGYMPIGGLDGFGCDGSGFLLIGCRGPKHGRLFAFDHGSTPLNITLPELFAKLAEAGARPKSQAEKLADAVEARDLDGVRAAVAAGAATVWMTRDGRMPLRAACEAGFDEAVLAIAERGDRDRIIEEALQAGRMAVVRKLFAEAPKLKKETLETILFTPATYVDADLLAAVAARGVPWEKHLKPKHGRSLVRVAAESGSVAGLQFLLEKGGKLDGVDRESGETVLHAAVREPKADGRPMIAFLLANGVPLTAGDAAGETALHHAIRWDNAAAAKALLDAGADLNFRARQNNPMMDDPKTQKMLARAEREMEKLAAELGAGPDPMADFADEDAPLLDPDDPQAKQAREMLDMAAQMQAAMQAMLPKLQAKREEQASGLGMPAAELGQRYPYPHVRPLIEELARYAASR